MSALMTTSSGPRVPLTASFQSEPYCAAPGILMVDPEAHLVAAGLDRWPVTSSTAPVGGSFSTVSHWYAGDWLEWDRESYRNDKRTGFLPFLDLPQRTSVPLLALAVSAQLSTPSWAKVERRNCIGWPLSDNRVT